MRASRSITPSVTSTRTEVETPHGPAAIHLRETVDAVGLLALGHGAGGGVQARDLVAAADAGTATGFAVALVEQPYRVAGRRSPAPAHQLDTAWLAVVDHLRCTPLGASTSGPASC